MFYTVKEISEKLRVSIRMVYQLISRGELACHKIGSAKRIHENDLQAYLASCQSDQPKKPSSRRRHF